jgi:hypothetical protein
MLNFKLIVLKIAFYHPTVPLSHKEYEMEVLKFHHRLTTFQIGKELGFVLTASGCIGVVEY